MIPVAYHIGAMSGKKLPYKREVEWLQSSETQWFTLYPTTKLSTIDYDVLFKIKVAAYGLDTTTGIIGPVVSVNRLSTSSVGLSFRKFSQGRQAFISNTATTVIVNNDFREPTVYELTASDARVNGERVGSVDPTIAGDWLNKLSFLLNPYAGGTIATGSYRIYYAKVSVGQEILDLIPVIDNNDVACFYNRNGWGGVNPDGTPRNDGFFYNQGTGEFAYGELSSVGGGGINV